MHFNIRKFIDRIFFGNPEGILPQIRHLPTSLIYAVYDTVQTKRLNKRLKERYFADKLILVAALPKSASSLIGNCVAEIMGQGDGIKRRRYAKYMVANQTSNLRAEMVKDFPNGGVLKYHTKPSGENLIVLELLGIRTIILFRHPADHLTAYCCNTQIELMENAFPAMTETGNVLPNHIYPVEKTSINLDLDIESQIDYLINSGYLFNVLVFMVDWLRFRRKDKSLVVTYETFMEAPDLLFKQIAEFLIHEELNRKTMDAIHDMTQRKSKNKEKMYPYAYKNGYTGKIGTWKDYFSKRHVKDYQKVLNSFLASYPGGDKLIDIYPDILSPQ